MSSNVCAIVVTYNRKILLEECLQALLQQRSLLSKIFVMDNGSTDETPKLFAKAPANVVYCRYELNEPPALRFVQGMRLGYDEGADWLWIMDDDVIPMDSSLELLLTNPSSQFSSTGCLVPLCLDNDGNLPALGCSSPLTLRVYHHYTKEDLTKSYLKVLAFCWLGCLLHRRVIDRVGFPRDELMIWYQDADYASRVNRHFEIYAVPASHVIHKTVVSQVRSVYQIGPLHVPILDKRRLLMSFYSQRDRTYCLLRFPMPSLFRVLLCLFFFIKILMAILIFQDEKWARLKLHLVATWHGLIAKLGRCSLAEKIQNAVLATKAP